MTERGTLRRAAHRAGLWLRAGRVSPNVPFRCYRFNMFVSANAALEFDISVYRACSIGGVYLIIAVLWVSLRNAASCAHRRI